jgi:hypothetical protein
MIYDPDHGEKYQAMTAAELRIEYARLDQIRQEQPKSAYIAGHQMITAANCHETLTGYRLRRDRDGYKGGAA